LNHDAERTRLLARAGAVTLAVNLVLTAARTAAGFLADSTAVLADAANSGTDIFATLVVLYGTRVAAQPPDEDHPYGHEKAEPVAAKVVALVVLAAGLATGFGALRALRAPGPAEAPGLLAAWVTAGSILAKELLARFLLRRSRQLRSEALAADAANQRTDVLASGAALAGVVGARLGLPALDPLAGLAVAALIVRMGALLYWRAVRNLMDTAPEPAVVDAIRQSAAGVTGVWRLDDLKARVHGNQIYVDLKICVSRLLTVEEGHAIAARVKEAVRERVDEAREVLVHVNPCPEQGVLTVPQGEESAEAADGVRSRSGGGR
jgi:cation diffusion facilitator family transporter